MPAPSASPFYFKSDDTFYSTRKASAVVLDLCAPLLGCCSASKGVVVDQSLAPWDFDVMLAIAHCACARQGIIEKSDDRKKASTQFAETNESTSQPDEAGEAAKPKILSTRS